MRPRRKNMYVRFITNQPKNPHVVARLTSQANTWLDPLDTLMKDNREKTDCFQRKNKYIKQTYLSPFRTWKKETYTEQNRIQRQSVLRAVRKEFGGLSAKRKPIKHTRRTKQEAVASRERRCKDAGINEMREARDARAINGNDERRLSSGVSGFEQIWIVVCNKHTNNEDTEDLWEIRLCDDGGIWNVNLHRRWEFGKTHGGPPWQCCGGGFQFQKQLYAIN